MDTNPKSASPQVRRSFMAPKSGDGLRGSRFDPRRWLSQSDSNRTQANGSPKRWSGGAVSLLVVLASFITPIAGTPVPAHATTPTCNPTPETFIGNGTNGTNGVTYTVLTFTTVGDCDWTVPANVSQVEVLVVGGGGGGGGTGARLNWSAGGGAGGFVVEDKNLEVTSGLVVAVTVGAGGVGGVGEIPAGGTQAQIDAQTDTINAKVPQEGEKSIFDGLEADGGGRAGPAAAPTPEGAPTNGPTEGGGGGGQLFTYAGAARSGPGGLTGGNGLTSGSESGQSAGGGAGAGSSGGNGGSGASGAGGGGFTSTIPKDATIFGGGGGGGINGANTISGTARPAGGGGLGGGGAGGRNAHGVSGTPNTGGGGGGAGRLSNGSDSNPPRSGGNGGSGVVIVRYAENVALTPTFATPTRTADGFTVQITNYSANFTWAGTATANGSVAISGSGLVTVTGVAAGTASTLTVTTTRTAFPGGSASVTASALESTPPTNNGSSGSSGNTSSPSAAPVVSPSVSATNVTPRPARPLSSPSAAPSSPTPAVANQYNLDAGPRALVGGQLAPLATTRSPNGGIALATPRLQFEMTPSGTSQTSSSPAPSRPTDVMLSRGQSAMVSGGGFAPRSSVRLSLEGVANQGLRELAQISVNGEGKFDTDLQFDARGSESPVPIGRHGLQVVGVDSEGNETLLNLTIAISQGDPQPEPNRTRGALPALSLGQSLATSAGIPETVRIEAISEAREVSVLSGTWRFRLNLTNDGGSVEQSDQGATMILAPSQTTTVSGEGFQPDTRVDVWLFSEPSLLGSVTVSGDGTFSGEFSIDPGFVAPGAHTLQLQGVGTDGYIKAANLGVLVQDSQASESTNPLSLLVWAIVALVTAAVIVFVALMIRNRRRK